MFKKVKKYIPNGKLRKIFFCKEPIYEYGVSNGKKFFRILLFNKQNFNNFSSQILYLKINKFDEGAKICIEYWIQVAKYINATIIILCDKKRIISKIKGEMFFDNFPVYFIRSERKIFKKFIGKLELNPWWRKAAYAHLTPLDHAIKNGIQNYWNIDADDTIFMIEPQQLSNYMLEIEKYANSQDISLFSLDMHHSNSNSVHWSYGITYTRNALNILNEFTNIENIKQWLKYKSNNLYCKTPVINIDWYTTFIRSQNNLKIDSFYIDNVYFLHYSNPLLYTTLSLSCFTDEKIIYPIFKEVYGINNIMISEVPISKNDIKFQFDDIDLETSKKFMQKYFINIEQKINIAKKMF